jgi:Zn-dependent metalloprotease
LSKNIDGVGKAFAPNPVQKLQDQSLKDLDDADQSVLSTARVPVTLARLNGNQLLQGEFATVVAADVALAQSPTHTFKFKRADSRFEQVNAYYGVDRAQKRIQNLGWVGSFSINNEPQDLKVNTIGADNSFYNSSNDSLTFGTGGVDDAEDLDVVWHEYGHSVLDDQVPGFGTSADSGAIGEGFGDYWAVSMSKPLGGGYQDACVMDWDATAYTSTAPHCLRRTDLNLVYPGDLASPREVHDDGRIWSRALWAIQKAVGRRTADDLILQANFFFTPDVSMPNAADCTVLAADGLYGTGVGNIVAAKFQARGLGGGTCI